jgi:hypothetical protein
MVRQWRGELKAALTSLLLVGLVVTSLPAQVLDESGAAPDVSVVSFDWKYAGYVRAETIKGNESISSTDTSTAVKLSRKTIYVFKYTAKARLKNKGAKSIKAVWWDYIFTDAVERRELKRYKLQSKQQILPGETQLLSRDVELDPKDNTRHITTGKQSIEITRIEYTDGSVWRQKQ